MFGNTEFRREYDFLTEQLQSLSGLKIDMIENDDYSLTVAIVISGKSFRFLAYIPPDYPETPTTWFTDGATTPLSLPLFRYITFTDQLRTLIKKCCKNSNYEVPKEIRTLLRSYIRFYFSRFINKESMRKALLDKRDAYIADHFSTFLSMADDNIKRMNEMTGDEGRRAEKITALLRVCQRSQVKELGRVLEYTSKNLIQPPHQFAQESKELTGTESNLENTLDTSAHSEE
nr:hypothetical protein HmN_000310100 [Hymenolepis microstoma]